MDNNLKEFVQLIRRRGIAHTNRFDVGFYLPAQLREVVNRVEGDAKYDQSGGIAPPMKTSKSFGGSTNLSRHMSVVAKSINDPGVTFNVNDTNIGYKRRMVYDKQLADLELVFICTGDMFEKRLFTEWSKLMIDETHRIAYYDDYVTDLTMTSLRPDGTSTGYELHIKEAFPIAIGQMQWDRSESNAFQVLPVTFAYRKTELEEQQASSKRVSKSTELPYPLPQELTNPQMAAPEAPDMSGTSTGQDLYRSINRVTEEVSGGMDPDDGVRVIERYVQGVQASSTVSELDKEKIAAYGSQVIQTLKSS